jgi:hypothetical protein
MTSSGISSDFVQSPAAKPSNRSKPARESVDPSTSLAEEMVLDTLAEEVVLDTRLDHLMFLAAKILHELNSLHQQRQTHMTHRITFKDEVRRFESELIRNALAITSGAQRRAAAILGMNASTLDMTTKMMNRMRSTYTVAVAIRALHRPRGSKRYGVKLRSEFY